MGDILRCDGPRNSRRASPRNVRSLRARSASRSDRSGSGARDRAKGRSDSPGSGLVRGRATSGRGSRASDRRSKRAAEGVRGHQAASRFDRRCTSAVFLIEAQKEPRRPALVLEIHLTPGLVPPTTGQTNDDVERASWRCFSKARADLASEPIPIDRGGKLAFADDESEAGTIETVGAREQAQSTGPKTNRGCFHEGVEVAGGETLPPGACHDPNGRTALNRQALAPLGASCVQDLSAAARRHTRTETVRSLALDHAGLKRALHWQKSAVINSGERDSREAAEAGQRAGIVNTIRQAEQP